MTAQGLSKVYVEVLRCPRHLLKLGDSKMRLPLSAVFDGVVLGQGNGSLKRIADLASVPDRSLVLQLLLVPLGELIYFVLINLHVFLSSRYSLDMPGPYRFGGSL